MAQLWSSTKDGCAYEVRSAGQSVRLYTNGVFHSQWNPNRLMGDAIWDLQVIAGFRVAAGLGKDEPLRALVLGVGGGAVIRQLLGLFWVQSIHGVDLDATHLKIARRWFGLSTRRNVSLVAADAIDWVESYRGPKFHLIIDDLFGHTGTDVSRSVVFSDDWAQRLNGLLESDGALVVNTASNREFREVCHRLETEVASCGDTALGIRLAHPRYENRILVNFKGLQVAQASEDWRQQWASAIERQLDALDLAPAHRASTKRTALAHLKRARKSYQV